MNKLKIAVTGATGFIGRHVINELLKHNVEIIATYHSKKTAKRNSSRLSWLPFDISKPPDNIFSELTSLNVLNLSSPIETEGGYALIFYYDYRNKINPNLETSWNLIYKYAKQNKQNKFFNDWVDDVKTKTYIKIFYN